MRIAVVGGTGFVGRHTVEVLRRAGHDTVVIARSRGVDASTGRGLDEALADAVVDVTTVPPADRETTQALFATLTRNVLAAGRRAKVGHHVLLSIEGVDRLDGNAHYAGKRAQEALVVAGSVPYTILRATQFHDFAGTVVGWTREGDTASVPPLLLHPVAVTDVADVLAEIAVGPPQQRPLDLAGPQPEDLVDMARRTLAARGESIRLIPSWRTGIFGVEAAGDVMLPDPSARRRPTTFDAWLARGSTR